MSGLPKHRSFSTKSAHAVLGTLASATRPMVWSPLGITTRLAPNLSRQVWGFFVCDELKQNFQAMPHAMCALCPPWLPLCSDSTEVAASAGVGLPLKQNRTRRLERLMLIFVQRGGQVEGVFFVLGVEGLRGQQLHLATVQ